MTTCKEVPPQISLVNGSKKTGKTVEIIKNVSGNKRTRLERDTCKYSDDDDNEKAAQNYDSSCQSSQQSTIDKKGTIVKRVTHKNMSSKNYISNNSNESAHHISESILPRSSQIGEDENEKNKELKIEYIIMRRKDTLKIWNHHCETIKKSVVNNGSLLLQIHDLNEVEG